MSGRSISGKKTKDGTGFEGQFTQHGLKMPLALKKTDKLSVAVRPQMPKPPFPYRSEDVVYENKAGGVKLAGHPDRPRGQRAVSGRDPAHRLRCAGSR